MGQAKVVEKIETYMLCSTAFPEDPTVYDIMWNNMV
jgi:hypothetical protein